MNKLSNAVAALALCAGAATSFGQVVFNEVYSNPMGSGSFDDRWEYIELHGTPGMSLDGYMIASAFGGGDPDGDNIPGPLPDGWDTGDEIAEIDEAWTLDGLTIGSNGFLVLYNNANNNSAILPLLPAATTRRTFAQSHIPTTDTAGRIKNDGSATYVLLRKRPHHSMNGSQSVYETGYAWRKDVNPDVNYNSRLDYGAEESVFGEDDFGDQTIAVPGPSILEPYQMVDDVSISNGGGKEYSRSQQQEISDTPTFNPDAISRVAFYGSNPERGWRIDAQNQTVRTRMADEEFIYGETPTNNSLEYSPTLSGGPTDPSGQTYNEQGVPDQNGNYLFDDISRTGFNLTPGTFNDVDSTGQGGISIVQYRFVPGDFNFDGVVDCSDRELIVSAIAATLDDTMVYVDDNNTPGDASDDITVNNWWKWQGREFQGLLGMLAMVSDGAAVTQADIDAHLALIAGGCTECAADFDGDGFITGIDYDLYVGAFEAGELTADFDGDGFITGIDFDLYVAAYEAGC